MADATQPIVEFLNRVTKALGVPPNRIEIVGGAASRIKRVKIVGDAAVLGAALEKYARAR